ncbi:hypothetical protein BKA70DRAFT_1565248 [Coprinopsis sp. MPI-PUGE-AT-0042]|nr:hypothetical protein BKA70DRAFT_1565248 [Coprinopsis sp. MPI-PUGE-AT-0042]
MSNPLAARFPTPALGPHALSPPRLPGISPQTTDALKEVLKDNHQRWHIFFSDMGFHNHASHRAIALWAVGAQADIIHDGYKRDCGYEKPAIQSPQRITDDNFDEHLGDDKYYSGYVEFFSDHVEKNGLAKTLEDWVFSTRANIGRESANLPEDKQPQMLTRFVAGVLHPIIHTGYGAEFSLPGMLAEGLAQCAVHSAESSSLVPSSVFDGTLFKAKTDGPKNTNPLDILGQVYDKLHAEASDLKGTTQLAQLDTAMGQNATVLLELANQWELDVDRLGQDEYLQGKIEEIAFLVVSMYGVSGWTIRGKDQPTRADFFFMHLVTSSIFLPSIAALISPVSRARLLHTYLTIAFAMYSFNGCPKLDFAGFYALKEAPAEGPGKSNPWLPIIEHAIEHHDEHLVKTQRALSTWASHFGSKAATHAPSSSSGIAGLEKLDGSVFLKTAQLTVARVGPPIKEHRPFARPTEWDFPVFA